jgi:ABC-2 type transport system ATP-binding protein
MNIVRDFLPTSDFPERRRSAWMRRDVRQFVRWAAGRRTMLLTTHYMASRQLRGMCIINAGKVLACDAPANLKRSLQREAIFHLDVSR